MIKRVATEAKQFYLFRSDTINLGLVLTGIILIYWQVIGFRFIIGWDDQSIVMNYFTIDGFSYENIKGIVTQFFRGQYAPINQLYYTTLYSLFGYTPSFYHFTTVIIHIINSSLVYFLVKRLVSLLCEKKPINNVTVSLITAMLFGISPFNIEAVVWVSASKVILYAFFYLAAIHFYLNYLLNKKQSFYWLTLIFFIISFGAKEQAVTLPLCLILIDYLHFQRFQIKRAILNKVPFFILSIIFGIVTLKSQDTDNLTDLVHFYPWYQRVALVAYTFSEYLVKTIIPINLSFIYPFPFKMGEKMPAWLWIYPIAIPFALILNYREFFKKWFLFGFLFFVIHILIVLNLVSLARNSIVADRYNYISSIGVYFIIAWVVSIGFQNLNHRRWSILAIATLGIYFFVYSNEHVGVWKNVVTLKTPIQELIKSRKDFHEWQQTKNKQEK